MSLRIRLTLLSTTLLGGILLLFGVTVYSLFSVILLKQVDDNLARTAEDILLVTEVDALGKLSTSSQLSLDANVYAQLWGREGDLKMSSDNFEDFDSQLDPLGYRSSVPVYRDAFVGNLHLRVLTVPLEVDGRPFGTLQIAADLAAVDSARRDFLNGLMVVALVSMIIVAVAAWLSTRSALAPLEMVTETALQITRADDLSRRIPQRGPKDDEVGQLILAFNQTLSRLEVLFNTQRRFLADVGHELRTPLTVMRGNVDLMRRMGEFDEESLQTIEGEVNRLTRLVGDLLLLAQAESGKLPLGRSLVELDTLLLDVSQQMHVLADGRQEMSIGGIDQVQVCGDRDRLKQVLLNLVGNAIKYTPVGGDIRLSLEKDESWARLIVADTGPGIPQEDLPHIFERFYRAERSRKRTTRESKGFGLGLSIAYWIVRNHGGRIEVDSGEGQGTTFCVWLPLAQGECEGTFESME